MTDNIKLPPLPPLHIVPSVEPVDYPEVARALTDYARAAVEADRAQRVLDTDDGLTVAYLYGFEKGKDVARSAACAEHDALRELLRESLEALTCGDTGDDLEDSHRCGRCDEYVDRNAKLRMKIRAALAQAQQPVSGADELLAFTDHATQPAEPVKVPSDAISVVGLPEFDALMDHIYENGTASEGVLPLANAFARAILARRAQHQDPPQQEPSEADKLLSGSVAVGSDGEWVSIRRHVRDEAVAALRAASAQALAESVAPHLLKFYGVSTDAELIAAQARHIERLQAKLPRNPSLAPQRAREG